MKIRVIVLSILVSAVVTAAPLGTEFTYQGVLSDAGAPASGIFDFRLYLYNVESGGAQVGPVVLIEDLTVTDGRMTSQLDFGSVFDGTALWLEVGVRDGTSTGGYTVLSPRQELTAAPFAQHAQIADSAATAGHATSAGSATVAGDSDLLDGMDGSFYLDDTLADLSCGSDEIARWNGAAWACSDDDDTPFSRTYVVGTVGTPTQNGTALRDAVNAITPPASQEEAVLLKLEPGVYDLGTAGVSLSAWMTIEGAGVDLTVITGEVCNGATVSQSIGPSGFRHLAVQNTCASSSDSSTALLVMGDGVRVDHAGFSAIGTAHTNIAAHNMGSGLSLNDVTLRAENGVTTNHGFFNAGNGARLFQVTADAVGGVIEAHAVHNDSTIELSVESSTLRATGSVGYCTSFYNQGDQFTIRDVIAEAQPCSGFSNGIETYSGSGTIDGFRAAVSDFGVFVDGSGGTVLIIDSNIHGGLAGVFCVAGGAVVEITHGRVSGGTHSVSRSNGTVYLNGVVLHGAPVDGTVGCTGCMRNGVFIATGCP